MSDPILRAQARRLAARQRVASEWENIAHLKSARSYQEYVEDKKRRGEKPMPKPEWESRGKGKSQESKGLKSGPGTSPKALAKANAKMQKLFQSASSAVKAFVTDPEQRKQMTRQMGQSVKKNAPRAAKALWRGFTGEVKAITKDAPSILYRLAKEKRKPTKAEAKTLYGVGVYAAGTALAFSGATPLLAAGKAFGHSITLHATFKAMSELADEIFLGWEAVESIGLAGGVTAPITTGDIPGLNHILDAIGNITKLAADDKGPESEEDKLLHEFMQKVYAKAGEVFENLSEADLEAIMEHGFEVGGTKKASYFNPGDEILFGKYKNKRGLIKEIKRDEKGIPTAVVEPVPKGRKKDREIGIYKFWHAEADKRAHTVVFAEEDMSVEVPLESLELLFTRQFSDAVQVSGETETVVSLKQADMTEDASLALMKMLSEIARRLGAAKHVYVVGGAVRNFVIDQPIKDIDVVIDSLALGKDSEWFAQQVAKAIPAKTNVMTDQYGVAKVFVLSSWELAGHEMMDPAQAAVEIANARKESYGGAAGKGYKPDTVEPTTIEQDVLRREFTFNTLMWRLMDLAQGPDKAEIIDLTGCGLKDLQDRRMQCPSDPDTTFSDDPSRMLRAVKFIVKYGMKLTPDTEAAIKRNLRKLRSAPYEAVAVILEDTLLKDPATAKKALPEMKRLGLLDEIAGWIRENAQFRARMEKWVTRKPMLFLFELMDLGLPLNAPIGFLDRDQQVRLRQITLGMPEGEPWEFLAALKQPGKVMDTKAIIKEFGLKGREIRDMQKDIATPMILANPELAKDSRKLTDAVRQQLQRGKTARKDKIPGGLGDEKDEGDFDPKQIAKGVKVEMEHTGDPAVAKEIAIDHLTEDPKYYDKLEKIEKHGGSPLVQLNLDVEGNKVEKTIPSGSLPYLFDNLSIKRVASAWMGRKAGLFEAPPAMLEAVTNWMISVYSGHALAYAGDKLKELEGGTDDAQNALNEMRDAFRNLERNVDRLQPGQVLKIKVYALRYDGSMETAVMGIKGVDASGYHTDDPVLYDKAISPKRLTFNRRTRGYSKKNILYWANSYLTDTMARLEGSLKAQGGKDRSEGTSGLREVVNEAKKYAKKPKLYSTGTQKVFPVDTSGWKYIRPGSKVIDQANARIEAENKSKRWAVTLGKEELKLAQAYYKTLRARKKDAEAMEQARQMLDSKGYQLGNPHYTPYKVRQMADAGTKPSVALARYNGQMIPVEDVVFEDPIGPKDIDRALAVKKWDHILCVLDFKGHSSRGGVWIGGKRRLEVDVSNPYPSSKKDFDEAVFEINRVLRHEMQHVGQDVLRVALGLREDAGLPSKNLRDDKYDPNGYRKDISGPMREKFRQDHALQDTEFYTRLSDEVQRFLHKYDRDKDWRQQAHDFAKNNWFFKQLQRTQRDKWKKAVGEFYKAVSEGVVSERLDDRRAFMLRQANRIIGGSSPLVSRPAYGETREQGEKPKNAARPQLMEHEGQKVTYRVKSDSTGIVVSIYYGRKRIGGMNAFVRRYPETQKRCSQDVWNLLEKYPQVEEDTGRPRWVSNGEERTNTRALQVYKAFIDDESMHGLGIGKGMYLAVMAEWFKKVGPFLLMPMDCDGSGTSAAAKRVWKSLARILPSSGDVIAVLRAPSVMRTAARYKNKKQVPKADGKGTMTVYEYSEGQVQHRNREKAKRVEKLRGNIEKLRADVKKDLKSKDEKTRLIALAVGLMDHTYERVGNDQSAKDGHFGVTGWQKKHVSFSGGKATVKYVGKSGVDQTKTVTDKALVSALKAACESAEGDDTCVTGAVRASDVNAYLKKHDITAKDIRGYHANTEVQNRLKAIRAKGGKLPSDPKEKAKKLKEEFKQALEEAAELVGHKATTLKSQYLVPGLERNYVERGGKVVDKLDKQGSARRVAAAHMRKQAIISIYNAWPDEWTDDKGTPDHMGVYGFDALTSSLTAYEWALINDLHRQAGHAKILMGEDGSYSYRGYPVQADVITELQGADYLGPVGDGQIDLSYQFLGKTQLYSGLPKYATKSQTEKEDEEAERRSRPAPSKKPPRKDLRRNRIKVEDKDLEGGGADGDKDLSLNYKKVAARHADFIEAALDHALLNLVTAGKVDKDAPKKGPGDYWEGKNGWRAWPPKATQSVPADDEQHAAQLAGGGEEGEGGDDAPDPKEQAKKDRERAKSQFRRETKNFDRALDEVLDQIDPKMAEMLIDALPEKGSKEFSALIEAFSDHKDTLEEVYIHESRGLAAGAAKDASEIIALFTPPEEPGEDEDEEGEEESEKAKAKREEAAQKARKEKLGLLLGADPALKGELLARLVFAHKVVISPTIVGGRGLAERKDPDELTQRASEAAREYSRASKEIRIEAAKRATAMLKEMPEDDPNRIEMEVILDGIAIAAAAKGESLEVGGEYLRPRMSKGHQALSKAMLKNGNEDILFGSLDDWYGPKGRAAFGKALDTMDDKDLADWGDSADLGPIAQKLNDPNVDEDTKVWIRKFLKRQGIEQMTTTQEFMQAAAEVSGDDPAKLDQRFVEAMNADPEYKKWEERLTTPAKGEEYADVEAEFLKWRSKFYLDWLKAMGIELPVSHPALARHKHIVDTGEVSLLDETLVQQGDQDGK